MTFAGISTNPLPLPPNPGETATAVGNLNHPPDLPRSTGATNAAHSISNHRLPARNNPLPPPLLAPLLRAYHHQPRNCVMIFMGTTYMTPSCLGNER